MLSYDKDILNEAIGFLDNYESEFKSAITDGLDFDPNEIEVLDGNFHSDITDRSYELLDAAFIIENGHDVEYDSGLWDGMEPEEAISVKAAFTFANDVHEKCAEIYEEIRERYSDERDRMLLWKKSDDDEEINGIVDKAWRGVMNEYLPEPIAPGTDEEKTAISRWLSLNGQAGIWGGYPLGESYIDSRCGAGYGMPDVKSYVDFDNELAIRMPHLKGKYKYEIMEYYEKTFGD